MPDTFDLIVIGGGPGGYVAAIRAAQLGLKTVCIEKSETLGGTCLNVGCIPSKALLQTTAIYSQLKSQGAAMGIDASELKVNFDTMMQRKESVVKSLTSGIPGLFKKNQVTVVYGVAKVVAPTKVEVQNKETTTLEAKHILIASGSEAVPLPFLPFNEEKVLSSTGALSLPALPKKMVVVGAGVIGVEIASIYRRLGTQVILVEMLDHICSNLDRTIHDHFLRSLTQQGLEFHLSSAIKSGDIGKKHVRLTIEEKGALSQIEADVVLVAVGRRPFSMGLGLEECGVKKDSRGYVVVNERFQTNIPSIFAIGDVIEGPMLAHRASEEGIVVAELLAGLTAHVDYMSIPNIIYTHPEVAAVGLSEQEAKKMGLSTFSGICYMKANPRARCAADTEGLAKVIGEKGSGKLIGIHLLAPQASEMISEGVVAIRSRMTIEDLAATCHGHPTFTEAIQEACLVALNRPIHT